MIDELQVIDVMDGLRSLPDASVDLVLTDPPYNISVKTRKNNRKKVNEWDRIADYEDWMLEWLKECSRVLKPTGVMYFWHNDFKQLAPIVSRIQKETRLDLISFCIWDKGDAYRPQSWHNRNYGGLRSWFNICEFVVHVFNRPDDGRSVNGTGLDRINSNPNCYNPLKEWYKKEKERLGLTDLDIQKKYTEVTEKKPYNPRHYFTNSQFAIPTKSIWESVYIPLGFSLEYESLRPFHKVDPMHCNIWHRPPIPSNKRFHTCQKPVDLLARMIRVSSRPGDVVLDPFVGSGSTAIAAIQEGRHYIGFDTDAEMVKKAEGRIEAFKAEKKQIELEGIK